jgi:ParB-like chromosome segregation protein Spo0J
MGTSQVSRIKETEPKTTSRPHHLLLREIGSDPEKFQWRIPQFNKVESAEHVRTLVRALRDNEEPFEALVVFPIESRFYVVDGHHRLAAYKKVRWKRPIPVRVFEGTLEEARLAALDGNVRDKLRMSGPEKREAAWKLVREGKLSKAGIVKRGVASEGTVGAMRRVLKKLKDDGIDPMQLSWIKARRVGTDDTELDADDWKEKKARKIVDALLEAKIGQGLAKDPEVTALALQMLNPTLPGALVREWWFDDPEIKSELAEELRRDEANPYELFEEEPDHGDAEDL